MPRDAGYIGRVADDGARGRAGDPRPFLDVALWGLAVAGGGFVLDVLTHLLAPGIGHDGRVLSLTPGHALMAVGAVMIAVGVIGGRLRVDATRPRRALAAFGVVAAAVIIAAGAATRLPDESHAVAAQGSGSPTQEPSAAGHADGGTPTHGHTSPMEGDDASHRTLVGVTEGEPTPAQRAAAEELLAQIRSHASRWEDQEAARAAGFAPVRPELDGEGHWMNRAFRRDDRVLDPSRPEGLVYRRGQLAGVIFKTPKGVEAPQPGGPLMVWHTHAPACAERPAGRACREAPKMLHAWVTDQAAAFDTAAGNPLRERPRQ